ncbi:hypothetical protein [Pseudoxanthomonas sp. 3HH-4]|uniref:hypothetical protein n=1 Tax=Pseudoxanthomonas sp. 3HH-4 TaxID=1690214 RepID=UPI001150F0BB|nr:hypothetical protein [Pseudoxanthomonas sp. 3HH-4]
MESISKTSSAKAVCQSALGLLLCTAFAVAVAATPTPTAAPAPIAAMIPAADRLEIERQLTEEVQARVNRQKRIEGQSKDVSAHVRFDHSSKRVIVDLSRGYVPRYAGGQLEDLEAELRIVVEELLMGLVDFSGVQFRYDGKSIQYFHPDPPRPTFRSSTPRQTGSTP